MLAVVVTFKPFLETASESNGQIRGEIAFSKIILTILRNVTGRKLSGFIELFFGSITARLFCHWCDANPERAIRVKNFASHDEREQENRFMNQD